MGRTKIVLKYNQRDITIKLSKGKQPVMSQTNRLNFTKFYHDIPKPYTVTECNRIALQTAIVYFFNGL